MKRLGLLCAAAAAAATLLAFAAPPAGADGDPASDYLLLTDVFYPFYSNKPKQELTQLQDTVKAAKKLGYPVKVAIITSPYDLGTVSLYWKKPEQYARFLSLELSFAYKGRLLIVSPNGYGYVEHMKPVPGKLAIVKKVPIGTGSSGLLETGDAAVRALAKSSGITLPGATHSSSGSGSNTSDIIIIVVAALVLVAVSAGVSFLIRRRRGGGKPKPESARSA